ETLPGLLAITLLSVAVHAETIVIPNNGTEVARAHRLVSRPAGNRVGPERTEPVPCDVIPWQNFISSDPNVCGGELYLSGTRVPVTVVLDSLAEGSTREE